MFIDRLTRKSAQRRTKAMCGHLVRLFYFSLLMLSACSPAQTQPDVSPKQPTPDNTTLPASQQPNPPETPTHPIATARVTFTAAIAASTFTPTSTLTPLPIPTSEPPIRFAVIGDYGEAGIGEKMVSDLVHSWNPDFILTVGDNNYPSGEASTIDQNIGQYYHDYIFPYKGIFGPGAKTNRFFPSLGNHDWLTEGAKPYLDYFSLPGYGRYYNFSWGPVSFFAIDSDYRDPAGITATSHQAAWLKDSLAASNSPWKIVYFHLPPYSSGSVHGSTIELQWPFKQWGATAVLTGHDHTYEQIIVDGLPYFVDGLGGGGRYSFIATPIPGSQVRYSSNYGAMLVTATSGSITFEFYDVQNQLIDSYTLSK
jgi:tartrate-resistant acid phosphatase type 5